MAMTKKDGEKYHLMILPDVLLRQVKALAASRAETLRDWFERATRAQIQRDLADAPRVRRRARTA